MVLTDMTLSRSAHDRSAELRAVPGLLEELWADPTTRVLRWEDGRVPVTGPGNPAGPTRDARTRLELVAPDRVPHPVSRIYLGRDDAGTSYLAAEVERVPTADGVDLWQDLRVLAPVLDDLDVGLLTTATALLRWHAVHPRCPRCGAATEVVQAGWVRQCPVDASQHFPRTDPAVIMSVVDDEGRILLGHNEAWPEGRYSTLAGFVEPGESLEAAVRREVLEEVGVVVGEVEYLGNQPWPFPASLMLGFRATAVSTEIAVDAVEITAARWFSREELAAAAAGGEVALPGGVSIAHQLVRDWYGGDLPASEWR